MGYSINGWVDFWIEIQFVIDEASMDIGHLHDWIENDPAAMHLHVELTTVAGEPLGAMVEGQNYNARYVRYSGPALGVDFAVRELKETCAVAFPRQQGDT